MAADASTTEEDYNLKWNITSVIFQTLAHNPFVTAKISGFDFFDKSNINNWSAFGKMITSVIFQLSQNVNKNILSQTRFVAILRWTVSDPRLLSYFGAEHLGTNMGQLYDSTTDAVDKTLADLSAQLYSTIPSCWLFFYDYNLKSNSYFYLL